MASPQVENGYLKVANELWEALTRVNLSDKERRLFFAVVRKTYGHNRCKDKISFSQLEEMTGLHRGRIIEARRSLEARGILTVEKNGRGFLLGVQKDYDLWDKGSGNAEHSGNTERSGKPGTPIVPGARKHKRHKDIYLPVFEHWNSKGIIKHRTLTEKMKRAINGRIREGYGLEGIAGAIDNYHLVLTDPGCYWDHRWTLQDFLSRGLDRFTDEAQPLENFRRNKGKSETCRNASAPYPRSEMALSTLKACSCDLCSKELGRRNTGEERAVI